MNSITKVNKLCKSVLKLTDEDFAELEDMITRQKQYINPLKHQKQAKFNDLGNHNRKVVDALKNLRDVIMKGAPEYS